MSVVRWRRLIGDRRSLRGQVATYLVLWTAVLMLLAAVTMNIGQVASIKVNTANAADTAALQLASSISALARLHCQEIDGGPDDGCSHQCGDRLDAALDLFVDVVIGVIGIFIPLLSYFTYKSIADILRATVLAKQHYKSLMRKIRRANLTLRQQLREEAMLTAFTLAVDDTRVVLDTEDFDDDGDRNEMISAFAEFFNERVKAIDDGIRPGVREILRWLTGDRAWDAPPAERDEDALPPLKGANDVEREASRGFLQWGRRFRNWIELDGPFERFLRWQRAIQPVGFWIDGGPQLYPSPRGNVPASCDPDVSTCGPAEEYAWLRANLPDQVDWLQGPQSGTLRPFVGTLGVTRDASGRVIDDGFIEKLSRMRMRKMRRLIRNMKRWEPVLKSFWQDQLGVWTLMLNGWIQELRDKRPDCSAGYGAGPGQCPNPGDYGFDPEGQHPTDWAISRLEEFVQRMGFMIGRIDAFQGGQLTRWQETYAWFDKKGYYHQVRVKITPFQVPYLHYWHPDIVTCVKVRYRHTSAENQPLQKVEIWRYDQDREIGRPWTFRVRKHKDICRPCRPGDPPDTCVHPDSENAVKECGIRSMAKAGYTWRRNDVYLVGTD